MIYSLSFLYFGDMRNEFTKTKMYVGFTPHPVYKCHHQDDITFSGSGILTQTFICYCYPPLGVGGYRFKIDIPYRIHGTGILS